MLCAWFPKHSSSSPGLIYLKLAAIQTEKTTLYLCKSKFVWLETKMFKGEEQSWYANCNRTIRYWGLLNSLVSYRHKDIAKSRSTKLQEFNKKLSFSFVSRCSHVWCRSRHFDCILLVFFRRWGRLVMHDHEIIRSCMTSRPHRLKKTSSMQSKRRDLHHTWLHRKTNEKLSFLLLFTTMNNHNLFHEITRIHFRSCFINFW